jgi:hypothetical protein
MPNIKYNEGMSRPARAPSGLLRLLTPDFRGSVALAHRVRGLLVELHRADGRIVRVSHDPAYRPCMSPCHLRLAVARASTGEAPGWLDGIVGWTVGGPLVDPLGFGAVGHDTVDGRSGAVATRLTPEVVQDLLRALAGSRRDRGDGFVVGLCGDPAMDVTVISVLAADDAESAEVDEMTRWIASTCRHEEWGRDGSADRTLRSR